MRVDEGQGRRGEAPGRVLLGARQPEDWEAAAAACALSLGMPSDSITSGVVALRDELVAGGVDPGRALGSTFTRLAAAEIRDTTWSFSSPSS